MSDEIIEVRKEIDDLKFIVLQLKDNYKNINDSYIGTLRVLKRQTQRAASAALRSSRAAEYARSTASKILELLRETKSAANQIIIARMASEAAEDAARAALEAAAASAIAAATAAESAARHAHEASAQASSEASKSAQLAAEAAQQALEISAEAAKYVEESKPN